MNKRAIFLLPSSLITIVGILLFIPFLGHVHLFDWDEINFAESAREMLVTGNYSRVQINFEPFWEKPPLFFWMQVLCMKMFGVNEFAARLPNAICGIFTLNILFWIGTAHYSTRVGMWWVLCYLGAFIPHFYFKSGIIDPWFNLFIFLSVYQLFRASTRSGDESKRMPFIWAGIFTGLAILTKGPVALLVVGLCALSFWIGRRFRPFFSPFDILAFIIAMAVVTLAWFGPETVQHGPWFLKSFLQYQFELLTQGVAGHEQPFYYHTLVLLVGCFPISLIAIKGFKKHIAIDNRAEVAFKLWMKILFWVVLILFSIVKTKIVHYSSLCWLPLTFLAAYAIEQISIQKFNMERVLKVALVLMGLIMAILLTAVPLLFISPELKTWLLSQIKDDFAVAGFSQPVEWSGAEIIVGVGYLVMLLLSWIWMFREKYQQAFFTMMLATIYAVQTAALLIVPKIEPMSQGAAIRFFESLKGKDVYVETVGYKSYAQYFYTNKQPSQRSPYQTVDSLMRYPISKPAYFVCKNIHRERLDTVSTLKNIGAEGGFVFYERKPE